MAIQERTHLFLNEWGALRASSVAVVVRQHGPHSQQLPSQPEQLPTLVPLQVPAEMGGMPHLGDGLQSQWPDLSPGSRPNVLSNVVEKKQ